MAATPRYAFAKAVQVAQSDRAAALPRRLSGEKLIQEGITRRLAAASRDPWGAICAAAFRIVMPSDDLPKCSIDIQLAVGGSLHITMQFHHLKCRKPATDYSGKPAGGYGFIPAIDYGSNPPPKIGNPARLARAPGIGNEFAVAAGRCHLRYG
jgi:hypothetical protein